MMQITSRWRDTSTSTVTIAAPGVGRKNVLQALNVICDQLSDVLVQSPSGTTIWQTKILGGGPGGYDKEWLDGLFAAENAALVVSVSAGTYTISINGVIVG